ncbi:hypothetical protein [Arthrobacter sp. NPDC057013]|uniref:hypothetical protein n=1 Tax=Arthrobacter sp. NPDC057013 TaxID=3345999 RepID=UPI003634E54D
MTFIEPLSMACPGQKCTGKIVRGAWVSPDIRRSDRPRPSRLLLALKTPQMRVDERPKWQKDGVHIVHTLGFGFGCIGVGLVRIGDVFGGSGGFSRVGAWFESHLGHVFSLFRGFFSL